MTRHALIDTYSEPSASLLAGYEGCCRYISHESGKCVTRGQVERIHAQGKNIVLNFEDSASNARGGNGQGVADGQFAVSVARSVGAPAGVVIVFSVDYEVHGGSALAQVESYFRGLAGPMRAAGYLIGAYADKDALSALFNAKLVDIGWQTHSWSNGELDARAALYQDIYTAGYDVDEIKHDFYGGWTPHGAQPNPLENPLADLTAAQLNQIADAVWHARITNPLTNKAVNGYEYLTSINTQDYKALQALAAIKAELDAAHAELAAIKSKVGA